MDTSGGSGGGSDSGSNNPYIPIPDAPKCLELGCTCNIIDGRKRIYELPGSYYNGTITMSHKITFNSAWTTQRKTKIECDNNDGATKSYSYPALFSVGPRGNSSDTNSIFWTLRGFEPLEPKDTKRGLDINAEWIYLRSADFVIGDATTGPYVATDETGDRQVTRTYWDTKVSGGEGNWNADTELTTLPPASSHTKESNMLVQSKDTNYVTLSDVCVANQRDFYQDSGGPSPAPGSSATYSSAPALFLDLNTKAQIQGIGSDALTFTLNTISLQNKVLFAQLKGWFCSDDGAWAGGLDAMQDIGSSMFDADAYKKLWNVTGSFELKFEGNIVRENSTSMRTGTKEPEWTEGYKTAWNGSIPTSSGRASTSTSGAASVKVLRSMRWLVAVMAAVLAT